MFPHTVCGQSEKGEGQPIYPSVTNGSAPPAKIRPKQKQSLIPVIINLISGNLCCKSCTVTMSFIRFLLEVTPIQGLSQAMVAHGRRQIYYLFGQLRPVYRQININTLGRCR